VRLSEQWIRIDRALGFLELIDGHDPHAARIVLVTDQHTTRSPAARSEVYPPAEVRRPSGRLVIQDTPRHDRWPNMAEIALSSRARQNLHRRLRDRGTMDWEVAAWVASRPTVAATSACRFTTDDARIERKRLYPEIGAWRGTTLGWCWADALTGSMWPCP
jgi:hypothetical protein